MVRFEFTRVENLNAVEMKPDNEVLKFFQNKDSEESLLQRLPRIEPHDDAIQWRIIQIQGTNPSKYVLQTVGGKLE